jgi:hypothetical protein
MLAIIRNIAACVAAVALVASAFLPVRQAQIAYFFFFLPVAAMAITALASITRTREWEEERISGDW